MLPSEICFTAAGFRVRPSVVTGVLASREWVYAGDGDGEAAVSYLVRGREEGARKGREMPKAIRRGRARWRKVGLVVVVVVVVDRKRRGRRSMVGGMGRDWLLWRQGRRVGFVDRAP